MSFIGAVEQGKTYAPGFFLAHEECVRETREIPQAGATTADNGGKYVKMGTPFPSNNGSIEGLLYEDVDVTTGNMPGSVVTKGVVYENRLPVTLVTAAKNALVAKGFVFLTEPAIDRPDFGPELLSMTVTSAVGTAVGDTKITISNYTPSAEESYMYKVATGTAPAIARGDVPDSTWSAWNGTADITAATGKKITIVSVDGTGRALAAGNATVTAKA